MGDLLLKHENLVSRFHEAPIVLGFLFVLSVNTVKTYWCYEVVEAVKHVRVHLNHLGVRSSCFQGLGNLFFTLVRNEVYKV